MIYTFSTNASISMDAFKLSMYGAQRLLGQKYNDNAHWITIPYTKIESYGIIFHDFNPYYIVNDYGVRLSKTVREGVVRLEEKDGELVEKLEAEIIEYVTQLHMALLR